MKVNIKRIDSTLPLPSYATYGSVCLDLYARENLEIAAKEIALIPTNIIVEVPKGYTFAILPRSSTPRKKGLLIPHGVGIVDQDYNGPKDEVLFQAYNFTNESVKIQRGERIAQGCFLAVEKVDLNEVANDFKNDNRGGVGSTG